MTACAIRFRLDGPGPAAFLVDCEGELRVYARGSLGGVMPRSRLLALLAERGCRWVAAAGAIELELTDEEEAARTDAVSRLGLDRSAVGASHLDQSGTPAC